MGKHYVPQAHLRRFAISDEPKQIWQFDKSKGGFSKAAISKVAQLPDYYTPEVETSLAKLVEMPANIAIDHLVRREFVDDEQRAQIAMYMMIMATRGPKQRRRSTQLAREAVDEVVRSVEEGASELNHHLDPIELDRQLTEFKDSFVDGLPPKIGDLVKIPYWSDRTISAIEQMRWHILPAPPGMHYVTTDTPAHYFENLGVGSSDSEFTFPISQDFALIGEKKGDRGIVFEPGNKASQIAKEVNRRLISSAERFVFSPTPDDWIRIVAGKSNAKLNLIRW